MSARLSSPQVERELVARAQQTTGTPAELDALATEYGLLFSELVEILKRHTTSAAPAPRPVPQQRTSAAPPAPSPTSKTCTNCDESKPLGEFYPDDSNRDGRGSWCRACNNRRQPTQARMLRNRARNRASAALIHAHADEFARLFADELQRAEAEHQRLVAQAAADGRPDAAVARLKPGPKRQDETDTVQRLDVARCPSCHTHHDDKHVCPNCGDETPATPDRVKPYMIRAWATEQGMAPIPTRGPLPARIVAAYHEARNQEQAS